MQEFNAEEYSKDMEKQLSKIINSCPNCHVEWTEEEKESQYCSSCGYPDEIVIQDEDDD